ncbi:sensor histidine kinase [Cellulomonas chitinilytica]|nr:histidine kinase [Cellulomonas chitinilytica]
MQVARRLWAEPRAPHAPVRVWRDWALLVLVVAGAVTEGVLRADVPWRPVAIVLAVGLAPALMWRRTHPLAVTTVVFGTLVVSDLASIVGGTAESIGLGTMGYVLVIVYALYRWGAGREVLLGSAVAAVAFGIGTVRDYTNLGEAVFGFVVVAFAAALGSTVRLVRTSRLRELDQVRLREREQLARELHDTVAHHVSAMVVRAQAGRVVAATRPEAATEALAVIEAEGARTLTEMRAMVGALRGSDDAELAPARGIADIEPLARSLGGDPPVAVQLTGALDDVGPAVGAAVFRIVQESLTNALRHARHATRIDVRVVGDDRQVRFTVTDDGDPGASRVPGYGVVGMTERAALLGGTVSIGPGPDRGWVVDGILPRVRATA